MGNTNMANREVCDLIFLDYLTKKPFLNLDYANTTTTELTGETTYAYGGKGHPKRIAFDGEKGGTLTIETQMQSFKLWELLTGGTISKSAKYYVRKELVAEQMALLLCLKNLLPVQLWFSRLMMIVELPWKEH